MQALGGEAGAALLQDRCLQALPNEAALRFPSLEHACQSMAVIVQSELFCFCSRQGLVRHFYFGGFLRYFHNDLCLKHILALMKVAK